MSQQSDLFAMSKVFFETGYAATSSVDNAMQVMAKVDLNEDALARTLSMMVRSHSSLEGSNGEKTWNVDVLVEAVNERNPSVNWTRVIYKLDHAEFAVYDVLGLKMILDAWYTSQKYKGSAEGFPIHVFFSPWQNTRGQLSILYQMLCAPPDIFNLAGQAGITKVIGQAHIMALNVALRPIAMQLSMFPLNCMEMISTILNLGDSQASDDARFLLDRLTVQYPELLLLGLAQLQPVKTELHRALLLKLLSMFLIGHANSLLVITLLMKIQPGLIVEGFLDMYSKDPASLPRILDIAQETKILVPILRVDAPLFVLDLAALAARRQHLNLDKWLLLRLNADGLPFAVACIDFLQKKCADELLRQSRQNSATPTLPLSLEVLRIFFRVLSDSPLPPRNPKKLWKIMQFCSQMQTMIPDDTISTTNRTQMAGNDAEAPIDQRPLAAEAEELVRIYFVKLYVGELSPEDFISILKKCHESSDQSQSEFFSCTVHTLLDEARFFSQYPDGELRITGKLFGLLIAHHLITHTLLQHALKHILDSLNAPVGSKLFHFGVYALAQFRDRLSEWPQYTMLLSKLPTLKEYPAIVDSINSTLDQLATSVDDGDERGMLGSSVGDDAKSALVQKTEKTRFVQQSSKLLDVPHTYDIPPEEVQEKVAFAINNLTMSNMDEKVDQLEPLLIETTWGWFSHYLVVRRVSIERNNHDLYAAFLTQLDKPGLSELVIEDTYRNIQILIQSESTDSSQSDRDTLKTLGTWLGKITLAKNKPIRHKDLSFKDLLLDCYDQKRLIVAIPLTCRVLQEAQNSKIFKPPNPWLMGILKLLAELYWQGNLSLKLKFEVEILYRALGLDLNEIEPTTLLERRQSVQAADLNGSSYDQIRPPTLQQAPDIQQLGFAEHDVGANAEDTVNWSTGNDHFVDIDVTSLTSRLQFSPAIRHIFEQNPATKMCVFRAITESLKKVVPSAISTTSNIAAASTRNLVLKDFATDPDEMKLKRAALATAKTLAARLAVATCKEPLCSSVIDAIRGQLIKASVADVIAQDVGASIVLDNLDLMEAFIEQLAQVRAISEVERLMAPSYASRKIHNEEHPREPYFDVQSLQGAPHNIQLPDPLRPNGSVNFEQMRLYDTFDHLPTHDLEPSFPANTPYRGQSPDIPANVHGAEAATDSSAISSKLQSMLAELDGHIRQSSVSELSSFKDLDQQDMIYQCMRHFLVFLKSNPIPLQDIVTFTERVVLMLFESNSRFTLESYTVFLQALFELYPDIGKEVIAWFIYADDERKYNADVTAMMMLYDLIPYEEYDVYLSKLVHAKADGIMDYAAALLKNCLLSKTDISVLEDHILTVSAFEQLIKDGDAPPSAVSLINDLEKMYGSPYGHIRTAGVNYLELRMYLAQWIRLNMHPLCKAGMLRSLALKITREVCKSDEIQSAFLRLCVQTAVQQYLDFSTLPPPNQYRMKDAVDSVARLMAFMMAAQEPGEHGENTKVKFFTHGLSIVVLLLVSHHESQSSSFDQRPFLRLLCSLSIECNKEMKTNELLRPFSEILYTIRPAVLPGFAFSWLQLISHRTVLSELLAGNDIELWKLCEKLIVGLLKFLGQLVEGGTLGMQSTQIFYRSALRTLVVLLHDFPEFLCYHYMTFISALPLDCIQIRNLVLSAFPRTMQLPDPSGPTAALDELPEFNETPAISSSYLTILKTEEMLAQADQYLENKQTSRANGTTTPEFFEAALKFLKRGGDENAEGAKMYHTDRFEALVLYVGTAAATSTDALDRDTVGSNRAVLFYTYLLEHLTAEGRYYLINAIADHLRYPNKHTYFFKSVILYLFSGQDETIKENITRALLERLIVNRPHPWGLLVTFIEILHAPDFWQYKFIHAAPEFQRLFENVLRYVKRQERQTDLFFNPQAGKANK